MKICKLDFASALKIHSSTSDLHVLENLDLQRGPNRCSSEREKAAFQSTCFHLLVMNESN